MENRHIPRSWLEKDVEKGILYAKNSTKCSNCGHTMLIGRKEKKICTWCGRYVFKDKKKEFEYRIKELI